MKSSQKMWLTILLLGSAGGALFVFLLIRHGVGDVASAMAAAGWGLAAMVAFHIVPMIFDVMGWRVLLPVEREWPRPSFARLFLIRWIGDSVSAMLPVAQVGGEVVRVRLAAARGVPMPIAAASVLAGMTVSVGTQIVFTLSGLGLLLAETGRDGLLRPVLVGSLLGAVAVAGFYAVQHYGMFRVIGKIIAHIAKSGEWQGLIQKGEELDANVRAIYQRRRSILGSCLWTMCVWMAGAAEVWIALWALGLHASYGNAYILESMSQGIRSAAFLVPGALGLQEGGYLVVGAMLGIPADAALALALMKRVRELAFGVPGLVAWQIVEGWSVLRRRVLMADLPASTPTIPKAP